MSSFGSLIKPCVYRWSANLRKMSQSPLTFCPHFSTPNLYILPQTSDVRRFLCPFNLLSLDILHTMVILISWHFFNLILWLKTQHCSPIAFQIKYNSLVSHLRSFKMCHQNVSFSHSSYMSFYLLLTFILECELYFQTSQTLQLSFFTSGIPLISLT